MKNLAIIPARSGSKGLKDKNIMNMAGHPLMAYTIQAAILSGLFDTVMVSTDSAVYADIARSYGGSVPFLRSQETSTDQATSVDVILEVLKQYEDDGQTFDTFALLQPTSPLRKDYHIREAYQELSIHNALSVVSVCPAEHSPLYCNTLPEDRCMAEFLPNLVQNTRRQDLGTYYRLNGAVYISEVEEFKKSRSFYGSRSYAYIMDKNASVDIDDEYDFRYAETILLQDGIQFE